MMLPRNTRDRILMVVAFAALLLLLGVVSSESAAKEGEGERKVTVQSSELPDNIRQAIRKAVPNGKVVKIEKEVQGEDPGQYDVVIRLNDKVYEVEMSPEGKIIEVKDKATDREVSLGQQEKKWTDTFHHEDCTFATTGRNRFFILEPGYRLVLESRKEKVVITVLDETKRIGNVMTRVVEEREEERGQLKEISRNFFAICKEHGDVFYFGEEVDIYRDGKVVKHEGAWRADAKDSKPGIMMPGTILLGARYYQEIAPNAKDRAEHMRDDVTLKTPAAKFRNCLLVQETSAIEDEQEYKTYAPGVGLIQDEDGCEAAACRNNAQSHRDTSGQQANTHETNPTITRRRSLARIIILA